MMLGKHIVLSLFMASASCLVCSTALGAEDSHNSSLEDALSTALADQLQADRVSIQIESSMAGSTDLDFTHATISFNELDSKLKHFVAQVTLPTATDTKSKSQMITGIYEQWTAVPVLKNGLEKGQPIEGSNIETTWVKTKTVRPTTISSSDQLIGMEGRHSLQAAKPLLTKDVSLPILVRRNDVVTVTYHANNLTLQSQAIALSSGSKGERIRLKNIDSNKEFIGIIDDHNAVIVPSAG